VCGDTIREVSFADSALQYCPTCQTGGKPLADRRLSRLLKLPARGRPWAGRPLLRPRCAAARPGARHSGTVIWTTWMPWPCRPSVMPLAYVDRAPLGPRRRCGARRKRTSVTLAPPALVRTA
jgi:hypothetical protein